MSQFPGMPAPSIVVRGTKELAVRSKILPSPAAFAVTKLRLRKVGGVWSKVAGKAPEGCVRIKPTKKLDVVTTVGEMLKDTNVSVPAPEMKPFAVASTIASEGFPSPFGSFQSTA